jgi:2-keto-3-deoxy-L-fuconate dehydrogenase
MSNYVIPPPMGTRLRKKRCLITAAAQGIGRATAIAFAREGAEVIATDINAAAVEKLAAEQAGIVARVLDVTDRSAVEASIATIGPLDVLFNCAGYVHQGTILECSDAEWRRSLQINVDGMFFLCKAVLPAMIGAGRGSIINMSSVASSIKGAPNRFAYGVTKAAVIGLTKSIAADFVRSGVRCNAICPGTINTPSLAERVIALGGDQTAQWRGFIERQPVGRLGEPTEVAALATYLASDESLFTTGQIHIIDGGWSN